MCAWTLSITGLLALACGGGPTFQNDASVEPLELQPVANASRARLVEFSIPRSVPDDRLACTPPFSALQLDYAIVEVGASHIRVSGEPVIDIADGRIGASELRGMLISRLYDQLLELAENSKVAAAQRCATWASAGEFPKSQPKVLLAIDASVPYDTVQRVLFTAGQAQFSRFYFLVDDPTPDAQTPSDPPELHIGSAGVEDNPPLNLVVDIEAQQLSLHSAEGEDEFRRDWTELTRRLRPIKNAWPDDNQVIFRPSADVSTGSLMAAIDAAALDRSGVLFPQVSLAGAAEVTSAGPVRFGQGTAITWAVGDQIPVLLSALPRVVPLPSAPIQKSDLLKALSTPDGGGVTRVGSGGLGSRGATTAADSGPGVKAGQPTVMGNTDPKLVQAIVRRHMNQIKYCYQRELTKDATLAGRIELKFVIGKDGHVTSAEVKSSTMNNSSVESCLSGRFKRMMFPKPAGGGISIVSFPFEFS